MFGWVILYACLLSACGGVTEADAPLVQTQGLERLPSASLEDWVSYADGVVVFEVTEEAEVPATSDEIEAGEGVIGRVVTVEVRDELWQRDGAPAVPSSFTLATWGWGFRGEQKTPMGRSSSTRLEVGQRYLAPVADLEGDGWAPIGADLTLPWSGGEVDMEGRAAELPSGQALGGLSRADLVDLLETTEPDPLAVEYAELGPVARYQAVVDAERATPAEE